MSYSWVAVGLSVLGLVLSTVYAWRVAKSYHRFHDERAAVSLAKAIGLWVISVGMIISAAGSLAQLLGYPIHSDLARAGLGLARGAFLVLMLTLVVADVRPGGRSE
jgi:uncharacterized membrane protein (DUF485 family)